ncbi:MULTISPECIES: ABC transporter permease [unclassified Leucobacter]|uniref:ABC transporter permease n=1 Tax=unclassified Leucobacter TaxID=2621730 RepID=UPI00165DDAC6|nr:MULTISPECIES: ABC transporter permease [unclassified Leucobacter]MBC9927894.1 ABC transporter permease [Leucobacter sp. cx-169]MBC9937594.1 ABC transporter permease [Leucobacter sp. cx-87]
MTETALLGGRERPKLRSSGRALLLLLPAYALLIGVFAYPVLESMVRSFTEPVPGMDNYVWALSNKNNLAVIGRTFGNGLIATVVCLVLAYPYAYLMTIVGKRARAVLIVIALIPFWTSLMIRTFAWIVLLQDGGVVNSLLGLIGIGPLELLRTNTGVIIGLSQVLMPFMVLPLYAVMSGIDLRLVTAARSLGASPFSAFMRVFVPLSIPGIAAGSLLVFIQALGFYVTPALLGSPSDSMLAQSIYAQVSGLLQWGRGGALGVILLVITLLLLGIIGLVSKLGSKRGIAVKVF